MIEDYLDVLKYLEDKHEIFPIFWELGRPIETEDIGTLAIIFNADETSNILINKEFWNNSTSYEKAFYVCHECLHVIFDHGYRGKDVPNKQLANICQDIVINHALVNKFGFDREKIEDWEKYCWVETIFPGENIPNDKSFEFYLNKLKDSNNEINIDLLGNHEEVTNSQTIPENIKEKIEEQLSGQAKESLGDLAQECNFGGDNNSGGIAINVNVSKVKKKRKWETVIKKWAISNFKNEYNHEEQWARVGRRFATLSSDFLLPFEKEIDNKKKKDKIEVWFFQDTSGSCSGFIKRFFAAAKSLPTDKFNIRMFCFDTRVYETTLASGKLYGFGGTRFDIIEKEIQKIIKKENIEYPKAVFVITDGAGNIVKPMRSEVWHWFLSSLINRGCIPNESHVYFLRDYE